MQSAHHDPYGDKRPAVSGSTGPGGRDDELARAHPVSALPSVKARALAFAAILIAGICGGLIGWSFVDLQCHGNCTVPDGTGSVVGAAVAAGGVAVVSVLVLRAMGEWKTIKEERELAEATQAAVAGASWSQSPMREPDDVGPEGPGEAGSAGGEGDSTGGDSSPETGPG